MPRASDRLERFRRLYSVVQAVDKKRARLNMIAHLLSLVPYEDVPKPEIELPPRVHHADYVRRPVPPELYIPETY